MTYQGGYSLACHTIHELNSAGGIFWLLHWSLFYICCAALGVTDVRYVTPNTKSRLKDFYVELHSSTVWLWWNMNVLTSSVSSVARCHVSLCLRQSLAASFQLLLCWTIQKRLSPKVGLHFCGKKTWYVMLKIKLKVEVTNFTYHVLSKTVYIFNPWQELTKPVC